MGHFAIATPASGRVLHRLRAQVPKQLDPPALGEELLEAAKIHSIGEVGLHARE